MQKVYTIVGLGELLWDLLPSGQQLGGAPANFAYISHLLGEKAIVASRVGGDDLGSEAIARLGTLGLSADLVQSDDLHPTGTIRVVLDERGEPTYHSTHDAAWDHLAWTPEWAQLAGAADAVCFGSLAQRSAPARATILRFLEAMPRSSLRLFDVNLRHSFFSAEMLVESMQHANSVKLNEAELPRTGDLLNLAASDPRDFAHQLVESFDLRFVAVTRGPSGSIIVTPQDESDHPGIHARVVDTVGAGDAFGAAVVSGYLHASPLDEISELANRVGAWMTTQNGATPSLDHDLKKELESLDHKGPLRDK